MDANKEVLERLPFTVRLSFVPLITALQERVKDRHDATAAHIQSILDHVTAIPEFLEPIEDMAVVQAHRESVDLLMSCLFPEAAHALNIGLVCKPLGFDNVYWTPKYEEIFCNSDADLSYERAIDPDTFYREHLLFAYVALLHAHYGASYSNLMVVNRVRDKTTNLERYYRANYHFDFINFVIDGQLKILPEETLRRLINAGDADELMRRMPLKYLTLEGFIVLTYHDITEKENISLLKSDLLAKDVFTLPESFTGIQQKFRSILRLPDLSVGIMVCYRSLTLKRQNLGKSLIQDEEMFFAHATHSIYRMVLMKQAPVFIYDLTEVEQSNEVERHLIDQQIKSLALIPLFKGESLVGVLELGAPAPGELNAIVVGHLEEIFPALTIAIQRQLEDLESRIQTTLRQHCTAIHPAVEWRFIEAADRLIHNRQQADSGEFEEIVFEDVIPLYGASDIRSSSTQRNQAIQYDLLEHIRLAKQTLRHISRFHTVPIANYYDTMLDTLAAKVENGLNSGDETAIIDVVQTQIDPLFRYIGEAVPELTEAMNAYTKELSPELGVYYHQRKAYEESVTMLNETIAAFLDQEDADAQQILPHYFEKYKTDGVEFDMYVGASLVRGGNYNPGLLRNMRLWQLLLMCKMTRLTKELQATMKMPLETTQLILVHSAPMTIRFSSEEKQFVVEGAYNIRYEIIKKRIDKSVIKGTRERLTQPGTVAIIYTQDKELEEYRQFCDYLVQKGEITPDIEHHDLEDLQGVHGLKALRVTVCTTPHKN